MSPLDALSPDQRAVVQLVLQQERSYEDLASMLGIPEDGVRARAVAGLEALVPGSSLSADHRAFITDFLLGQLSVSERENARRMLRTDREAREWALDVSYELSDIAPDALPEVPAGEDEPTIAQPAFLDEAPPMGRPVFDDVSEPRLYDADRGEDGFEEEDDYEEEDFAAPSPRPRTRGRTALPGAEARPRASRLGGALLIFGIALFVAAVLIKVLGDGGDDDQASTTRTGTTQTSTTPQARQLFTVPLEGVAGSEAVGAMQVLEQDGAIFFTFQAQNVPRNRRDEAYAMWFIGGGKARRLGYFTEGVDRQGRLGTIGPGEDQAEQFPRWLTRYKRVVISRETQQNAARPGPIIMQGVLPSGA